ncbi:Fur family transcriptional regulator [Rhizobium sp. SSA_523]|uniref:Fur family transcriptional regulator n=1 Tax=Rhizobium sp. SSA_523 TaxID=2952477 RepID=UPI0020912227|nr:Fur family transcriptional regulator [Rhizobium sp. SSA_523]MCO5730181.1 transcriptional repressor [Rhizobium sp. SSA_523]WKC25244.1 Fur family transcriptional regulator [Rhizobium sp. SSA_523]
MTTPTLTKNQTLVFQVLTEAEQPMSAYTILDKLRDHGFRAPLQVYRALEKLLDFGLVHRLESLNSFVACSHTHETCCQAHGTVAFAICEKCGQVNEFHDHAIDDRLRGWAQQKGFKAEKTTIELRGLCSACAP